MPEVSDSYCNPLNLPYRFQFADRASDCFREAADPSVVVFDGRYWLFASKSGGYWSSADLHQWAFVKSTVLPVEDYAPDVRVIDGWLYFTASRNDENCPIYRSQHPELDQWEKVSEPFVYWDPNLFEDEDGQVYLYWGCSNKVPIQGVKMDAKTMQPIGEPVALFGGKPQSHGWERCGDNHSTDAQPFIEGAWMTKHQGRYYLQYAGPGTEWNVYGDGVYESDAPLGSYNYAANNPFSYKPGGFITGAGHGSTFYDVHGNLWHISTMRISVKHAFERRVGLFPAGFDEDGELFCNTRFADYPMRLPQRKFNPWHDAFAGWMLLSFNKPVTVSSSLAEHVPAMSVNENIQDFWSAKSGDAGEWLTVDLEAACDIHCIQVNFAEMDCRADAITAEDQAHAYELQISSDGKRWQTVCDKSTNQTSQPHDYVTFTNAHEGRYVKIINHHMPVGGKFALSGLRVFGKSDTALPSAVEQVEIQRNAQSPMDAYLKWESSKGVIGYNVLWGTSAEKLYHSWQVYDQIELQLGALDHDRDYHVRVDAYNEGGITPGQVMAMPAP